MQDDPNKDNPTEHPVPDVEDWEHAFEPYEGFPGQALMLGFNFVVLKGYLAIEPINVQAAIKSLDVAMEVVFRYSQFHEVAYRLFHKLVEGQLTLEEEELLKSLGLEF